jgi:hypothetical protein
MQSKMPSCHSAIRCIRHLPILIVLLYYNGCTYIMIDHYYAPNSIDRKEIPYEVTSCEHTLFSTGPVEAIEIDNDNMSVTIAQGGRDRNLTYISAGPFIFPVIPIFPINWLMSDNNQFFTLKLDVKVKNNANIKWKIKDTVIVTPDKNRISPITYQDRKADVLVDDTVLELRSWEYYRLRYPLTAKTATAFRLSLQGFSIDDKLIVLPSVEFHEASSWKMCGAP